MILSLRIPIAWATWFIACCVAAPALAADLNVLFLGDNGHHRPHERFVQLQPVLATRGIHLVYTDKMADVNPDNLRRFDALLLYANIDRIESDQEKALLDYVAAGRRFRPAALRDVLLSQLGRDRVADGSAVSNGTAPASSAPRSHAPNIP